MPATACSLDFKLGRVLGHGNSSQVFCAMHRLDGQEYALKIVKPRSVSEEWRNNWLQVGLVRGCDVQCGMGGVLTGAGRRPHAAEACAVWR